MFIFFKIFKFISSEKAVITLDLNFNLLPMYGTLQAQLQTSIGKHQAAGLYKRKGDPCPQGAEILL